MTAASVARNKSFEETKRQTHDFKVQKEREKLVEIDKAALPK
jgi:hypothetical protein